MIGLKRMLVVFCSAALLLAGCGGSGGAEAAPLDPETAAQALLEQVEFRDTLVKADAGNVDAFYQMDGKIESFAVYISGSGGTAEEIAVLKPAEGATTADAKGILERRVEDQKFRFEDYVPAEMVKLESPVIVEQGGVAILVLADDYEAAKKAVEGLSK